MVEREENPIIVEKLMQDRFTKQAVDRYTLKLTKMASLLGNKNKILMAGVLGTLCRRKTHLQKIMLRVDRIKKGFMVKKYNFGSSGFHFKFVKVVDGDKLVWCDKESDANNPKKRKEKDLAAALGVLYGPVTDTWAPTKSNKNKDAVKAVKLSPWKCMSILFKERSLDMYFDDVEYFSDGDKEAKYHTSKELDDLYLGLSYLVQKNNVKAYKLNMGKFFWRKAFYLFVSWCVSSKFKRASNKPITPVFAMSKWYKSKILPEQAREGSQLISRPNK